MLTLYIISGMGVIYFYDSTEKDKQQLDALLKHTTFSYRFVEESLNEHTARADADCVSVFVTSKVDDSLLARMPGLKLIACRSTGFDNIDVPAAKKRGITVSNVPTYGEVTVAEYTFALILSLSRKIVPAIKSIESPTIKQTELMGFDLEGKTLGILGAGHIGQHVAKIAKGFSMRVLAYDPFPNEKAAQEIGFAYAKLDEVLQKSDVISLHMPYSQSNHHLLNRDTLAQLKPGSLLINTARGELIDNRALIDALQSQKLAGAALDVLEGEQLLHGDADIELLRKPSIPHKLLENTIELQVLSKLPNVILTPHNAFNTDEAIRRINEATVRSIKEYAQNGTTTLEIKPATPSMGKLIIARHAESEWNAQGIWTGSRDVHLSEQGFRQSAVFGQTIEDITLGFAYTSQQIRAFETLEGMLDAMQQFDVPYERSAALNERNYGDYTGKNKWDMQKMLGEETFDKLRRNWDYPVPNGETLKMVYERAVPYYLKHIVPKLKEGKNVLLVSHGNAIRALIKYIENVSNDGIAEIEMLFGDIIIYDIDPEGHSTHKTVRQSNIEKPNA